jgi:benzoylformate decarboxylase
MAKMTGSEVLMEILRKEGVKYVFGIPGATELLFMDAIEKSPDIKYILGLNEVVCVGMAEGYARTTGKPGFLNLHTNTGLSASLAMLLNAQKGGVPLVVTAGQQDTRLLLRDPALWGNLVEIARPFTKWSAEVLYPEDIPIAIQRAFKLAMQPPTGPVFVSLPQNVLGEIVDFEYTQNTPTLYKIRPDKDAINLAVDIILKAKRPIILVETGITKNNALSEIVKFSELIGAPVYQTWMSDVNFPVNHPQYLGALDPSDPKAKEVLKPVDVFISVGVPLFRQAIYSPGPILPKHIKVIQIDDDPWEIGKNFPVSCGLQGHIKETLVELIEQLNKKMSSQFRDEASIRKKEIAQEKQAMETAFLKKAEEEWDFSPISVRRFVMELKEAIKPGTLIVDDCWSSSGILQWGLGFSEPLTFQRARGGGSIGWGLSGSLGVKLGAPEKPVVAVCGDGSALWSIQSLWTAAHYHIPVTFIILSNATYAQVKVMRKKILGGDVSERHEGMELDQPTVDFSLLAKSMGVNGERIERPEALKNVLRSAFEANEPRLIEVLIQKNPPL